MNHLKTLSLISAIAMAFVGLFIFKNLRTSKSTEFTIGIIQTASHPALDAAREGFMDTVQQSLGGRVNFIVKNAQGSLVNAHAIAQSLHANRSINLVFAIATPAAQAMAAVEKEKPILIAAVTNPTAAGIVQPNVTGTSDMIDVAKEIALIPLLLPKVKTVAVVFNNSEINSATIAEKMITELGAIGLTPLAIAISSEMDLIPAIDKALNSADALLAPTDNTIACAIQLIADHALAAHKPLIVSDNLLVKHGALAARGIDYHESGKQAGSLALQVLLDGKIPADLPLKQGSNDTIIINQDTAHKLEIIIPQMATENVIIINGAQNSCLH